jgi:hypothetical protein
MNDLTVLLFDIYPNADRWLDENAGVAVSGYREYMGKGFSHIKFSSLMPPEKITILLEHFPGADDLSKYNDIRGSELSHPMYSVELTRLAIVKTFQGLGAFIKKSPCCMEIESFESGQSKLREVEIRLGKPLSICSPQEISNIYRKLF